MSVPTPLAPPPPPTFHVLRGSKGPQTLKLDVEYEHFGRGAGGGGAVQSLQILKAHEDPIKQENHCSRGQSPKLVAWLLAPLTS